MRLFRTRGFTLIELLVYVSIMGALITMVVGLYSTMGKVREKAANITNVESQGYEAMQVMTQALHNAQWITTPSTYATTSTLTLSTYTASTSPTTFFATSSTLYITEGPTMTTALTNSRVVVTDLEFANFTASTTDGSVKIILTLQSATSSKATPYTATFYGTGTVRNQQ